MLAQQAGVDKSHTSCLKANSNNYKIGPWDYLVYDKEESINYWKSAIQKRQVPPGSGLDYLDQIVSEDLGDSRIGEENHVLRTTTNQSMPRTITPLSTIGTPNHTFTGEDQVTVSAHRQLTTPRQPPPTGSTMVPTQTTEFGTLSRDDLRQVLSPVFQRRFETSTKSCFVSTVKFGTTQQVE